MPSDHKFQVNLRGIIDLLSHHLYSGPQVYLRELLQNGVDAISARRQLDPQHEGTIRLELIQAAGSPPTLLVTDNGLGLTEEEVHQFLATIGESSKRDRLDQADFIGRFGIGMLSGFVVSDEIVVITRSAKPGHAAVRWSGRADGTYSVKTLEDDIEAGTQIFLRAKPGCHDYFDSGFIVETSSHYGGHLPFPIHFSSDAGQTILNEEPPWKFDQSDLREWRELSLQYGRSVFGEEFLDAIPLRSEVGRLQGTALILSQATTVARKQTHRVYLKNMLLSESSDNLLPPWAFFVQCVVNANDLRPTASRESFYEDESLAEARDALGACLRNYLIDLARSDRERLDYFIALHILPIKALAIEDDEFFRIFVHWLPFETSLGSMTLEEYTQHTKTIRYVPTRDQFRQISGVAAAQSQCIINGGYVYDQELLDKLGQVFPEYDIQPVDVAELSHTFGELTLEEREQAFDFVRLADLVLQPYQCTADIRKFKPTELPTLYTTNESADFMRSVEQSKDVSNDLWSSVLDQISADPAGSALAQLCFNFSNPLIQQLAKLKDRNIAGRAIEMLYVQALLLGHYPLKSRETKLMSSGLLGLIETVIRAQPEDE